MKTFYLKSLTSSAILLSSVAQAGGINLYEIGNTDLALASAGMAARAEDSSVLAANPAGLANVEGKSFAGAMGGLYGDAQYTRDDGTEVGNVVGFLPIGSFFYSQQVSDNLTLGVGMYGNWGLALEFDYMPFDSAMTQAYTVQPSMAYRLNDQWSLGASIGVHYGIMQLETPAFDTEDSDLQLNGKFGLLYELNDNTRFGLAYTADTGFEFEGMPTEAVMPQQIVFSAYHKFNDKLAIMGNVNWQDWSEYSTTFMVPTQDTYHAALGMQYSASERTMFNVGFAYDTSILESQDNGDFTLPTGKAYRIGTGVDYRLDEAQTVGIAFEALIVDESKVTNVGAFNGKYDEATLLFLTVNYTWSGK